MTHRIDLTKTVTDRDKTMIWVRDKALSRQFGTTRESRIEIHLGRGGPKRNF